jgi:hypothetical protein
MHTPTGVAKHCGPLATSGIGVRIRNVAKVFYVKAQRNKQSSELAGQWTIFAPKHLSVSFFRYCRV